MSADIGTIYLRDIVRTYRNYRRLGEGALAQVSDGDLNTRLENDSNSIAVIVKHLSGNLRSRFTDFLTTDGEKPDRNRDGEFEIESECSRDEVLAWWNAGWKVGLAALDSLTTADLDRIVYMRGEAFHVIEALDRLAAHTAYHVGQIVFLAKYFAGPNWKSLSIPKGQSALARGTFKHDSNP
jgi:Protein of unknown function (DUF1572)